jgi:hypothetical protein
MTDNEQLRKDLTDLFNRHSVENESNTPDYLLAEFVLQCLAQFERFIQARDAWYGMNPEPGTDWASHVPEPPRCPPSHPGYEDLAADGGLPERPMDEDE